MKKVVLPILSLLILVSCCCASASAIGSQIIRKVEEIARAVTTTAAELTWEDNHPCRLDTAIVRQLQSYTKEEVNPEFYTYLGFRNWGRLPLVYPYAIHVIDSDENTLLADEHNLKDYRSPNESIELMPITDIQGFSFDENYLLVKFQNAFALFYFKNGEVKKYQTEEQLFEAARKLGFNGQLSFMTYPEYGTLFNCSK